MAPIAGICGPSEWSILSQGPALTSNANLQPVPQFCWVCEIQSAGGTPSSRAGNVSDSANRTELDSHLNHDSYNSLIRPVVRPVVVRQEFVEGTQSRHHDSMA
jgi:hypothetical protein